MISPAQFH